MQWSDVGAVLGPVLGIGGIAVATYGLRHSASSARASAVSADAAQKSVEIAERTLDAEERRHREGRIADLRVEDVTQSRDRGSFFFRFHIRNAGPATANGVQLSLQFTENPRFTETLGPPGGYAIGSGDVQVISGLLPEEQRTSGEVWTKVNLEYYDLEQHHLELVYCFGKVRGQDGFSTSLRIVALDGKRRSDSPPPPASHDPFPIPEWLRILD